MLITQRISATMLDEMDHCVSLLFNCRYPKCSKLVPQVKADGVSGHGPVWNKIPSSHGETSDT